MYASELGRSGGRKEAAFYCERVKESRAICSTVAAATWTRDEERTGTGSVCGPSAAHWKSYGGLEEEGGLILLPLLPV